MLLIVNTIIWGAALPLVKYCLEDTTAFRYLFYRYVFASLVSIPVILHFLPKIKNKLSTISKIIVLEIVGVTLNLSLLYIGLSKTSSVEASLISEAGPILTIIGGVLIYKERIEKNEAIGYLIALAGTFAITLVPLFANRDSQSAISITGNMFVVGYCIVNTLYYLLVKKLYKGMPKFFAAGISFFVGLISFLIISIIEAGQLSEFVSIASDEFFKPSVLIASSYMGILGSFIALTFYLKAQDKIEVSEASIFAYLMPVITIPIYSKSSQPYS
jgi:drug/metabolite transporter (DMT)-like permease